KKHDTLKPNDLIAWLMREDRQRKAAGDSGGLAMAARTWRNDRSWNERGERCKNCGRRGHTKSDCYLKGGGKEGQAPWQRKERAQIARTVNDNMPDTAYLVQDYDSTTSQKISNCDWLLDSASTKHVATRREMFSEYAPYNTVLKSAGGP